MVHCFNTKRSCPCPPPLPHLPLSRSLPHWKSAIFQLATGWQKTSGINREDYMVNPVSKEEITLDHILAAEFIQKAFRRFLEFRRIDCEIGRPMGHKPPATGDGAAMTGEFASVEGTRGIMLIAEVGGRGGYKYLCFCKGGDKSFIGSSYGLFIEFGTRFAYKM